MDRIRLNPVGGMSAPAAGKIGAAPTMPTIAAPVHMAGRVGASPLHNYLGHFNNPAFLRAGHNTNWIAGATANSHGQFKAKAKRAGMSTHAYAEKEKGASGRTGKQARLALTLMGMGRGKK